MKFTSFEEIINYAADKEKEAAQFYKTTGETEKNPAIKKIFDEFALEEEKHFSMLKYTLDHNEVIENYTFKPIQDLKISDYMTEITYEPGMSYPDLLSIAMKREEEALKFYTELAEETQEEKFKNVFKALASEEAKHKNILETQYDDYLASQGG